MGPSALVQVLLPGGATRTRSDAAICASPSGAAKFFETMLSTPAWILFWRCNPHAPGSATLTRLPFPCSSGSAFRTCPDGATHASQRCLADKRFSPISSTASHRCSDGVSHTRRDVASPASVSPISSTASRRCSDGVSHTRRDVASPASVTVHSIASIVQPGLGGGPTLALLRSFSQAEFTSPSPSWRLMEDRSCSLSFPTQHRCCFLHCLPFSVS